MLKHAAVNRPSIELGVMDHSSGTFWLSPGHRWPAPALWCTSVTGPWWRWSRPTPPPGQKPVCTCPSAASRTSPRERRETHTHTQKSSSCEQEVQPVRHTVCTNTLYVTECCFTENWDLGWTKISRGGEGKKGRKKKTTTKQKPFQIHTQLSAASRALNQPCCFPQTVCVPLTNHLCNYKHTHTHILEVYQFHYWGYHDIKTFIPIPGGISIAIHNTKIHTHTHTLK